MDWEKLRNFRLFAQIKTNSLRIISEYIDNDEYGGIIIHEGANHTTVQPVPQAYNREDLKDVRFLLADITETDGRDRLLNSAFEVVEMETLGQELALPVFSFERKWIKDIFVVAYPEADLAVVNDRLPKKVSKEKVDEIYRIFKNMRENEAALIEVYDIMFIIISKGETSSPVNNERNKIDFGVKS